MNGGGGLFVPNKERLIYRAPEAKSRLGNDLFGCGIFFFFGHVVSFVYSAVAALFAFFGEHK